MVKRISLKEFTLNRNFDWGIWNLNKNEVNIALLAFDTDYNQVANKTELFKGVKKGRTVKMSGERDLITLDFDELASGTLGIVVVESDLDSRKAAEAIENITSNEVVRAGIKAGVGAVPLLPAAVTVPAVYGVLKLIALGLGMNGDDNICKGELKFDAPNSSLTFESYEIDRVSEEEPLFTARFEVV